MEKGGYVMPETDVHSESRWSAVSNISNNSGIFVCHATDATNAHTQANTVSRELQQLCPAICGHVAVQTPQDTSRLVSSSTVVFYCAYCNHFSATTKVSANQIIFDCVVCSDETSHYSFPTRHGSGLTPSCRTRLLSSSTGGEVCIHFCFSLLRCWVLLTERTRFLRAATHGRVFMRFRRPRLSRSYRKAVIKMWQNS
eukprot:SAG31_NODE_4449_length_3222_cov_1.382325_5_plen_198_part_01